MEIANLECHFPGNIDVEQVNLPVHCNKITFMGTISTSKIFLKEYGKNEINHLWESRLYRCCTGAPQSNRAPGSSLGHRYT